MMDDLIDRLEGSVTTWTDPWSARARGIEAAARIRELEAEVEALTAANRALIDGGLPDEPGYELGAYWAGREGAKVQVKGLAKAMAEVLNGGEYQSNKWYNGDQRKLWKDRAERILRDFRTLSGEEK